MNKILLKFIEKRTKKNWIPTEYVRKQLKTSQNIMKMLSCIENDKINIQ